MVESSASPGQSELPSSPARGHVCPWWIGWLLLLPLRRLFESPEKLLGPHVRAGMTVLEPGCAMGFFSLPLARMVGPQGRVLCVDLQENMIRRIRRRAQKAGLADRIETVVGTTDDPTLDEHRGAVDFAAAVHMVHEVTDKERFFRRLAELLRPGARLLIVEPKGHVSAEALERTVRLAQDASLVERDRPLGPKARAVLLERPAGGGS